jgi:hypothetical protein
VAGVLTPLVADALLGVVAGALVLAGVTAARKMMGGRRVDVGSH